MTLLDALVVTTLQAGRLPAIDPAAISVRRRSRPAEQAVPAKLLSSLGNAVTRLRQRLGKLGAARMVEKR